MKTDVLALAGVNADLMSDEWIAVQGRPLGCRQSGCGRPAVDDRQLCREHGWWQPVVPVNMRKGIPARTYIGHDLDLSARTTPSDAWMEQASCRGSPGRDFFGRSLDVLGTYKPVDFTPLIGYGSRPTRTPPGRRRRRWRGGSRSEGRGSWNGTTWLTRSPLSIIPLRAYIVPGSSARTH